MNTKTFLTIATSFVLLSQLCSNLRADAEYRKKNTSKKTKEIYPICANKLTVAVDDFKTEDFSFELWTNDVALNSREIAVDELVNSGCYTVLEREKKPGMPIGISNEKSLARSDEAKKGSKVAQKKQMKIADHLFTFAITGAKKGGEGFRLGWLTAIAGAAIGGTGGDLLSGLDAAISSDQLFLSCRITDTATSEVLASQQVKVKDANVAFSFDAAGGSSEAFGAGTISFFKNSKVGKMVSNAVNLCSIRLSKALVTNNFLQVTDTPNLAEEEKQNSSPNPKISTDFKKMNKECKVERYREEC